MLLRSAALLAFGALCLSGNAVAQDATKDASQIVIDTRQAPVIAPPANLFTGQVTLTMLTKPTAPGQAGTALVTFMPGARTNWHTHPAGQTLYVTSGCGWSQAEGEPVQKICAGDVVYVKPGVRHWHGATRTQSMTHLAITESHNGKNVVWQGPVTDTQFLGPEN